MQHFEPNPSPDLPLELVWGEPATDPMGGAAIAQYRSWAQQPLAAPEAQEVDLVPNARLFPGRIVKRKDTRHWGGQLLLDEEYNLLRGSYSLLGGGRSLPEDVDIHAEAERLEGDHFFLGSAHRHFGHFILEGMARLWAWEAFDTAHPEGKCLIYEAETPAFIPEMLERFGIPRSRLLFMDRPLVVERLHVPTPSMRTHRWIHPNQRRTWLAEAEACRSLGADSRVYLSRRSVKNRRMDNEVEIEKIFAAAGFRVVEPETLSIEEQIALARGATTLAGGVGSQLYLAAFQPAGAHNLVLAPSNFYLSDDVLIASVCDSRISLAFGSAVNFRETDRSWTCPPAAAEALLKQL